MPLLQGFIFVERNTNKTILYMSIINKASLILSRFFFKKKTPYYICVCMNSPLQKLLSRT